MRKLIKFLSPYKGRIGIMLLLLFIQVIGTLFIPTLTADIVNNGIATGNLDYVWKIGGFMLVIAVATAVFSICGTYTSTHISTSLGKDIRGALFRKAQDFSVNDFNKFGAASLITRSTSDVTQIQTAFSIVVEMLLPAPFMAVAGLVLAFSKNASLAFMVVAFMIVILIATVFVAKKVIPLLIKCKPHWTQSTARYEKVSSVYGSSVRSTVQRTARNEWIKALRAMQQSLSKQIRFSLCLCL